MLNDSRSADEDLESVESDLEIQEGIERESIKVSDFDLTNEAEVREIHDTKIIFYLPFYRKWEGMIICSVWLSLVLSMYNASFGGRYASKSNGEALTWYLKTLLIIIDIAYAVDVIFATIHKIWKDLQIRKMYLPRPFAFIAIDIISLIPVFNVYDLFLQSGNTFAANEGEIYFYTSVNRLLRTYRIMIFFINNKEGIQYTTLMVVFTILFYLSFIILLLTSYFFTIIWQPFNVLTSNISASLPELNEFVFTSWPMRSELDWYKLSLYIAADTVSARGVATYNPITSADYAIYGFLMTLLTGMFLYLICVYAVCIIGLNEHYYLFLVRYCYCSNKMSVPALLDTTKYKVIQRLNDLRMNRQGIVYIDMESTLPEGVRGDIVLDIYWDALNHSHLFRGMDKAFLSEVAKQMSTHCYSAEQPIFTHNELKSKMIYVLKGMIHVVVADDHAVPLMNFTSGTNLGESSLVISYPNNSILAASSYCEIQVLDKKDLLSLTLRYREHVGQITKNIFRRYVTARRINLVYQMSYVGNINHLTGKRTEGNTKWVKRRLELAHKRALFERDSRKAGQIVIPKPILGPSAIEVQHTMKYFDTVAVNETAKHFLKKIVLLTTSFPIIINPQNPVLRMWKYFVLLNIVVASILIPYYASVAHEYSLWMSSFSMYVQFIYLLDLWIQTTTAVNVSDTLILKIESIFYYRLGEKGYITDIISSLPFGYMPLFFRYRGVNAWALFHYNKLLQLWKLIQFNWQFNDSLVKNKFFFKLVSFTISGFYIEYFFASVIFMVSCFDSECDPHSWWMQLIKNDPKNSTSFENFVFSFRFAQSIFTGTRLFSAIPYTMIEHVLIFMLVFFSNFIRIHFNGFMVACKATTSILLKNQAHVTESIASLLQRHGLSKSLLHRRTMNQLNTYFTYDKGLRATVGTKHLGLVLIKYLYPHLLMESRTQLWGHYFFKVPLFQEMPGDFIFRLSGKIIDNILPPNAVVRYSGDISKTMFVIDKGFCEVLTCETNLGEAIYGPGWSFYGLEMVLQIPAIKTVRTVTCCRLLTIKQADLNEMLSFFPEYKEGFDENIKKCHALVDLQVFEDSKADVSAILETHFKKESVSKHSFYKYSYDMIEGSKESEDYNKPFRVLGRFSLLRLLLLRLIFLPDGRAIFIKEGIRCLMATVTAIIFPVLPIIRLYHPWAEHILTFLDITVCIDIYISLHLAYYNSNGIVVTHPLETAKHYLTHSFALDLLGVAPLEKLTLGAAIQTCFRYSRLIQMHRIFGMFSYLDMNLLTNTSFVAIVKYIIVMFILTVAWASIYINQNCEISFDLYSTPINITSAVEPNNTYQSVGINCSHRNWYPSLYGYDDTPSKHLAYVIFVSAATFTQSSFRGIKNTMHEGAVISEITIFLAYVLSFYMTAQIVHTRLKQCKSELHSYRRRMRNLSRMMKTSDVDEALVQQVYDHFIINWEAYRGIDSHSLLSIFYNSLKDDILGELCSKSFKDNSVFTGASHSFFRSLLSESRFISFASGAVIFKKYDVHSKIYIINKGLVNVYFRAGKKFITLGPGAVFGNFQGHNKMQHMCNAVAHTKLDVICLATENFLSVLRDHPRTNELFLSYAKLNFEFIGTEVETEHESADRISPPWTSRLYWKLVENSSIFDLQTVIASLCACIISTYVPCFQNYSYWLFGILYFLDFHRLCLMLLTFYLPFKNDCGDLVQDQHLICQHYLHTNFWIDCVSLIPIELLSLCFSDTYRWHAFAFLHLNRAIVLLNYNLFYYKIVSKISTHFFAFQWGHVIVSNLVYNHLFACVISLIFMHENYKTGKVATEGVNYWECVTFVMAMQGKFSFYYQLPMMSQEETLISVAIVNILINARLLYLAAELLVMLMTHYSQILEFNSSLWNLLRYLNVQNLSYYLITVVEDCHDCLWRRNASVNEMLDVLPIILREEIMNDIFSYHFARHYVFKDCHKDFVRQLVRLTTFQQYIPNSTIVRRDVINGTMYFVHTGQVMLSGERDDQKRILQEGTCFGTQQGLQSSAPHHYTYRAYSLVKLVQLKYERWQYLLTYFPKELQRVRVFARRR